MGNTFSEDGSNPIRRNVLPWEKKRPETEQVHFVERWQQRRVSFVELCRQFGISRKTGYSECGGLRSGAGMDWGTAVELLVAVPIGPRKLLLRG